MKNEGEIELGELQELPSFSGDWKYSAELEDILKTAAWCGHLEDHDTPVTFVTLFWALIHSGSFAFMETEESNGESFGSLKALGASLGSFPSENRLRDVIERKKRAGGQVPVPTGSDQKYYSKSVSPILKKAENYSLLVVKERRLSPRYVMAAYLLDGGKFESKTLASNHDILDRALLQFLFRGSNDISTRLESTVLGIIQTARNPENGFDEFGGELTTRGLMRSILDFAKDKSRINSDSAILEPFAQSFLNIRNSNIPYYQNESVASTDTTGSKFKMPRMSRNCARIMLIGQEYSRLYFRSPDRLEINGLIAAVSNRASETLENSCAEYQFSAETTKSALAQKLGSLAGDLAPAWNAALRKIPIPEERVSTYRADDPYADDIQDQLEVDREAKAFARIAASTGISPPLAFGVFGHWGTGKSFFMNLMCRHIKEELTDHQKNPHFEGVFHKKVVQIHFNAWHYMECNLWASLVEHIFRKLDEWLHENEEEKANKLEEGLYKKLESVRELTVEEIEEAIVLQEQETLQRQALEEAAADYEEKIKNLKLSEREIFEEAVKSISGSEDSLLSNAVKQAVKGGYLPKEVGNGKAVDQAKQLLEVSQETMTMGSSIARRIGNSWTFAFILLVMVGIPVGGLLMNNPDSEFLSGIEAYIKNLTDSLSYYLVAGSGILSWLTAHALRSKGIIHRFKEGLDQSFEEKKAARRGDLDSQRQAVEAAREGKERALARVDSLSKEISELLKQLEAETPKARLNKFIRAKVTNQEYAKHLGIIATIRRDFSKLAEIMADNVSSESENTSSDGETKKSRYEQVVDDLKKRAGENKEIQTLIENNLDATDSPPDAELKVFNRIILYIDDLDRCPPEKVVDVLQAIHLLLCFPLFVVVVAVDARWVSRSLKREFPDLLEEQSGISDNCKEKSDTKERERYSRATPLDFIEKIFQIPYWVKPMEARESSNYVEYLVAQNLGGSKIPDPELTQSLSEEIGAEGGTSQNSEERGKANETKTGAEGGRDTAEDINATTGENPEEAQVRDPEEGSLAESEGRGSAEGSEPSGRRDRTYEVASMVLTTHETKLLAQMAPFTGGSPRRALRFVNSYRLAKTSLDPKDLPGLVGDQGQSLGYRALVSIIAITTGAPYSLGEFEEAIRTQRLRGLPSVLEFFEDRTTPSSEKVESENVKGVLKALGAERKNLNSLSQLSYDVDIVESLNHFFSQASRFSFAKLND